MNSLIPQIMLKTIVVLWTLYYPHWCNASLITVSKDNLVNISNYLLPLDALNFKVASKDLYKKLFQSISHRYFVISQGSLNGIVK